MNILITNILLSNNFFEGDEERIKVKRIGLNERASARAYSKTHRLVRQYLGQQHDLFFFYLSVSIYPSYLRVHTEHVLRIFPTHSPTHLQESDGQD
jgi:hypothetical protein